MACPSATCAEPIGVAASPLARRIVGASSIAVIKACAEAALVIVLVARNKDVLVGCFVCADRRYCLTECLIDRYRKATGLIRERSAIPCGTADLSVPCAAECLSTTAFIVAAAVAIVYASASTLRSLCLALIAVLRACTLS